MERARFVKWMLGVAGVCAMLMALYVLGGWWRIGVHFAVNQICVGVSAGKIYFALAFSMLFCLRAAWLGWRQRETHAAWNRRGMVVFAHGSGSSRFSPRNRQVGGMAGASPPSSC